MDNVVFEMIGAVGEEEVAHPPLHDAEGEPPADDAPAAIDITENVGGGDRHCLVCFGEALHPHVIVACGHGPVCRNCVQQLAAHGQQNSCIVCRADIIMFVELFL